MQGVSFSLSLLQTITHGIPSPFEDDHISPERDDSGAISLHSFHPHPKAIQKSFNPHSVYILFHHLIKKIRYLYIV